MSQKPFKKGASHWAPLLFLFCVLSSSFLQAREVVDLTHPFNSQTIYWPTAGDFVLTKMAGHDSNGIYHAGNTFAAPEHGGTHIDAPSHFIKGGQSVDQIPATQLVGDLAVIDVSNQVGDNADYAVSAKDIETWESVHKKLSEKNIVLIRTGWERFWPDKKKYLGTEVIGPVPPLTPINLRFPGLSPEAARLLTKRNIKGVGLDTASVDLGSSRDYQVHRILLGKNIYGLENVANLKSLPSTGAILYVAPMKIEAGTGAPVRLLVVMPE